MELASRKASLLTLLTTEKLQFMSLDKTRMNKSLNKRKQKLTVAIPAPRTVCFVKTRVFSAYCSNFLKLLKLAVQLFLLVNFKCYLLYMIGRLLSESEIGFFGQ